MSDIETTSISAETKSTKGSSSEAAREGRKSAIVKRGSGKRSSKDDTLLGFAMSLGKKVAKRASKVAKETLDADRVLMASMSSLIEAAAQRYPLDPGAEWKLGEPLRLLLVGYTGVRNTGADVRVEEMLRQFRHIFGDDHVALSVLTIDPDQSAGYFRTVRQLKVPTIFPKFLFDAVHEQHGVITCEGSMFKSKFASALTTLMVGGLGLASAEQKLSVAYGGEAGDMIPALEDLVRKHCQKSFVITRNEESRSVLGKLGIGSEAGTDTAWSFKPAPASEGHRILREHGWDGEKPVLICCPINPFWWPVKPDVKRGVMHQLTGAHGDAHYKSIYFHNAGREVDAKQAKYLDDWAAGVRRFMKLRDVFPVCVGMERLDRTACEGLSERIGEGAVIVSDDHEMYEMVSVLRSSSYLISSRYHAIVTSMPGSVPSAGITMDERIRNLMIDRGQPRLALEVDDKELEQHVFETLLDLDRNAEQIREGIEACVVTNLERMGRMGMSLVEYVKRRHPEFPFREGMGQGGDPWEHLPELPPEVRDLVARVWARKGATA